MQKLFLLCLVIILCSANTRIHSFKKTFFPQWDTTGWINSFREFRNAIYKNDRAKVKQFIDFSIMNDNNEIWYLAYNYDDKLISKLPTKIKPFTEKDFDKYYSKVFTKRFINTILKIKSNQLYITGAAESIRFKDRSGTYKMYVTFDKEDKILTLNLASETAIKTEDGGEFNVIYQFDVVNNHEIKFRQVRLAG